MLILDSISTLLFRVPPISFYQFFMGIISINNLLKDLNNMRNIKKYLERWVGASIGLRYTLNSSLNFEDSNLYDR
ncbi:hypothetical protein prwr041_16220 [Prevotella herbatica]|uniref:Uncharacterized protein n=1 Tax=Prevotella herbatica TaxID=2801997 RepID=A0ABM7NYW9_9BACT|nr:hypothetical protein prwr041_16220 [Prevotella herbatica]